MKYWFGFIIFTIVIYSFLIRHPVYYIVEHSIPLTNAQIRLVEDYISGKSKRDIDQYAEIQSWFESYEFTRRKK
jgi:hypothetical protein